MCLTAALFCIKVAVKTPIPTVLETTLFFTLPTSAMLTRTVILALAVSAFATPVTRQSCADVTVYFARGTGESGTIGTIVGPPFQSALQSALGSRSLDFIGINYPASIAGFLAGGDPGGATTMANSVTSKASSCPNTKIVISGYR